MKKITREMDEESVKAADILTRTEQICICLSRYSYNPGDKYNIPWATTQDGIALQIGSSRERISGLKKKYPDLFEERLGHTNSRCQRYGYLLTPAGQKVAESAKAKLRENGINPENVFILQDKPETRDLNLLSALRYARKALEDLEASAGEKRRIEEAIGNLADAIKYACQVR
ncbi:MAG: hypothetical protein LBJ20_00850 [Candidatus Methanoplasma sp.]|jgi:hypothetical protein|nr:hypothetical protein [Candidatus Methanoplasma sp.]